MIPLQPVKSSNLAAMGYDPAQQQLVVRYQGAKDGAPGKISQFTGVPPDVFSQLQAAESKGSFFYKNIRGNDDYQHAYLPQEENPPAA